MNILIYFLVSINVFFKNKVLKYSNLFLSFLIIIIYGIRYDMGIDYLSYERIYENLSPRLDLFNNYNMELGYELIQQISKVLNLEFYIVTIIVLLIVIYFIYYGLKELELKKKEIAISYFVFLTNGILFSYLNIMRQGLATVIMLLGVAYFKKNKKLKGLLVMLLAILFHKTVIFYLPILIVICVLNIDYKKAVFILIGSHIVYDIMFVEIAYLLLPYIEILPSKYAIQTINMINTIGIKRINIGIILKEIIFIIIIFSQKSKKLKIEEKLYLFSLIFKVIGSDNYMLGRIGIYMDVFSIPVIAKYLFEKNNEIKTIKKIIIITILTILYARVTIFSLPEEKNIYKTILLEKYKN